MRSKRLGRALQRGFLALLFLTFTASALLRIGALDLTALASAGSDTGHSADTEMHASESAYSAIGDSALSCQTAEPLQRALDRVNGRAEQLDARELQLTEWAANLSAAEVMVEERLAALQETETRIEALLTLTDSAAEADLARLTDVYETMAPADAAALFAQMDPGFAAGFLGRMSAESAAGVLAELDPPVAYSISVLLATRNAAAPSRDDP